MGYSTSNLQTVFTKSFGIFFLDYLIFSQFQLQKCNLTVKNHLVELFNKPPLLFFIKTEKQKTEKR